MDANGCFASIGLKLAREDAKKVGVKIPKLSCWADRSGNNPYYEVWVDGDIVWAGSAYNASEAKSRAIYRLIKKAGKLDELDGKDGE